MNILEKIVTEKKRELLYRKSKVSRESLKDSPYFNREKYSITEALKSPNASQIIAEFKRESPSKGVICENANVSEIIRAYSEGGASAVSVLTESTFFKGSYEDFRVAREILTVPLLRKDFMIEAYQFYEAKAMGADLVLLIASLLSAEKVLEFTDLAHSLDLEVLLEIHNERELEQVWNKEINLVGVNNRDLTSFKVDLENSFRLADKIPLEALKISESGISDPRAIIKLKKAGYQGFLMGETFMKEPDPGKALQLFQDQILFFKG